MQQSAASAWGHLLLFGNREKMGGVRGHLSVQMSVHACVVEEVHVIQAFF